MSIASPILSMLEYLSAQVEPSVTVFGQEQSQQVAQAAHLQLGLAKPSIAHEFLCRARVDRVYQHGRVRLSIGTVQLD
jgi:hypothetical protein